CWSAARPAAAARPRWKMARRAYRNPRPTPCGVVRAREARSSHVLDSNGHLISRLRAAVYGCKTLWISCGQHGESPCPSGGSQVSSGLASARKTVQWTVFSEPGAEPAAKGRAGADSPRPTGPLPPPVLRMRRLPAAGVVQERLDLTDGGCVERTLRPGLGQHVPPGAQVMQRNAVIGQPLRGFREDAIVENHRRVGATRPRLADCIDKGQFRAAVGGQVLDQQHPLALAHLALDPRVAAVAL